MKFIKPLNAKLLMLNFLTGSFSEQFCRYSLMKTSEITIFIKKECVGLTVNQKN